MSASAEGRGKLFVGGIAWQTTESALEEHFGKYGEVRDVVVIRDRDTGACRGFGFVEFRDASAAKAALEEESHEICGKMVEVRRAMPRGNQNKHSSQCQSGKQCRSCVERSKKLFVGGLPDTLSKDEFQGYFENFGTVTDSVILYDNATNKPRGFGFITFDSVTAVDNVMRNGDHQLNGKFVDVKQAIPKDGNNCRNIGDCHDNNYGARVGFRGEPAYCGYQGGLYPLFASRTPYFHGPPPPTYFYGVNHFNGHYEYGYGSHYASSCVPWSGHPSVSSCQGCFPYDNSELHHHHVCPTGTFCGNMNITVEYDDNQSIKENPDGLDTKTTDTCNVPLQSVESELPHASASQVDVGISESVALQTEDVLSDATSLQAEGNKLGQSLSEVEDITIEMDSLQVKSCQ